MFCRPTISNSNTGVVSHAHTRFSTPTWEPQGGGRLPCGSQLGWWKGQAVVRKYTGPGVAELKRTYEFLLFRVVPARPKLSQRSENLQYFLSGGC